MPRPAATVSCRLVLRKHGDSNSAVSRYLPGGTSANRYRPLLSVRASRELLSLTLVSVTLVPGTIAPLMSLTSTWTVLRWTCAPVPLPLTKTKRSKPRAWCHRRDIFISVSEEPRLARTFGSGNQTPRSQTLKVRTSRLPTPHSLSDFRYLWKDFPRSGRLSASSTVACRKPSLSPAS